LLPRSRVVSVYDEGPSSPEATEGAVLDEDAGDDGFALSGFPEFVRSGDGFWGDASRELDAEELTDSVVAGTAAALRRGASWASVVTHSFSVQPGHALRSSLPVDAHIQRTEKV
jgi:hypothetical protein